jgi:hypothetical protein
MVFGRSLFSLKFLAIISSSLCLLGWVVFIARYQGMRTALLFTLLFAFPPPMCALLNLMGTIASHHLINPLMALHLIVLFKIIEDKKKQHGMAAMVCYRISLRPGNLLFL